MMSKLGITAVSDTSVRIKQTMNEGAAISLQQNLFFIYSIHQVPYLRGSVELKKMSA